MDALMLLTADHNRIRGLLHRFNAAHEHGDVAQVGTLAERIVRELEVHTKIEEEIFYPAARAASEQLEEIVAEGIEEHHVVDHLITELGGLPSGADQWVAKMLVMIENVEHHAGEEEKEMFPQARSALDADTLADLAERLESRKAQLGAPTVADKEHLTLDELRKLAQAQEIPGRSDMNREQLLATVAPE